MGSSRDGRKSVLDELSSNQIRELRASFSIFDRDHDGVISAEELHDVMRTLGDNPSESEVQEIIYQIDQDGKGAINFEEFATMMSKKSELFHDENEDIKATFMIFDKNHDGFVTVEEMKEVLSRFDLSTSTEEIQEMVKSVDQDGDGMLSFDEFSALMKKSEAFKLNEITQRQKDEENIE